MLLLVMSIAVPAFAYENLNAKEGKQVVYLDSKDDNYVYFQIAQWSGNETNYSIKKPTVSKGTSGAVLRSFQLSRTTSEYNYYGDYPSTSNSYNGYAHVNLDIEKAGTAKITYTIGGVKKTINLTIKDYVNPIKTVTLTGVNSGKNFKSKVNSNSYMSTSKALALKATTKSAKLVVKPIDGWKLESVSLQDTTTGLGREIYNYDSLMTSATINWGTLNAKHNYRISVYSVNTENGCSISNTFYIHGANADANFY